MLGWLVERLLRRQERQLGEPLGYLRKLYRLSPAAFWKFGAIGPLAQQRLTPITWRACPPPDWEDAPSAWTPSRSSHVVRASRKRQ
jgi:hypothetical protein